ncbi:MAG: hypothetical protein AAFW69_06500, partial [Pseudomonadota bacterium]
MGARGRRRRLLLAALMLTAAAPAAAEAPRSAIPWLSESLRATEPEAPPPAAQTPDAPAPTGFEVTTLGAQRLDAIGLLPAATAGLREDFWGATSALRARQIIRTHPATGVPATRSLFDRILIARLDPPRGSGPRAGVLLARIDRLMAAGALDRAEALVRRAGLSEPEIARRAFDIGLLTGRVETACDEMLSNPRVAPTLPARVFCLARLGDWPAAAMTQRVGERLGSLEPGMAELLARFIDPEAFLEAEAPPLPETLTPLHFMLREALFLPRPRGALPLAFLQNDLDRFAPPRTRIEAAERLARSGALPRPQLFAIYRDHRAATSGGAWGRAEAVQALDRALAGGAAEEIAAALAEADLRLSSHGLRVALAEEFAPALALRGIAGAGDILLLGGRPEALGAEVDPVQAAASAILTGAPPPETGARRMLGPVEALAAVALEVFA